MNTWLLLLLSLGYMGLLFAIALWFDRQPGRHVRFLNNPLVYALSLGVYCTAWTFFGSVGRAADAGVAFLPIYLGPTLMAALWFFVLRKIVIISKYHRISSPADFIATRFGKSTTLGIIVTLMVVMGVVPYIALQLKAVSISFDMLNSGSPAPHQQSPNFYTDSAFGTAIILALFAILFGTRHLEATEQHRGLVGAIAFESIVKLITFLGAGIYVTFWLFDGPADLFGQALRNSDLAGIFTFSPEISGLNWFWLIMLSMLAVLFLPRQWHMAVVENTSIKHLRQAMWLFPLYLFLINIFVLPIALGGKMLLGGSGPEADAFVLSLPLAQQDTWVAFAIFIGGLSASTGMVIVSSLALSIMISNNLLTPFLLRTSVVQSKHIQDLSRRLIGIRRLSIVAVLLVAFTYLRVIGDRYSLVSIGLISFAAVAQLGPAMAGALFWRRATKTGAIAGLIAGFLVWAYTLPFPSLADAGLIDGGFINNGLWGMHWLRPYHLFGMEGLEPIAHSAFWSLFFNAFAFVGGSLLSKLSPSTHAQTALFVDIYRQVGGKLEPTTWRGVAYVKDIADLLIRFLGRDRAQAALDHYGRTRDPNYKRQEEAKADLVQYAEKLLTGAVGAPSARLLVSATVKEEPLTLRELMVVMNETKQMVQYSRQLEEKSRDLERASRYLQQANEQLKEMDQLKDDFITTVTHELRTPMTSIRSLAQIIREEPDLEPDKRNEFLEVMLSESDRVIRLINQVLDLERMETGKIDLELAPQDLAHILRQAIKKLAPMVTEHRVNLDLEVQPGEILVKGDADRLTQVVVNLLSNAFKFCDENNGQVWISLSSIPSRVELRVKDNGQGIRAAELPHIFDKFTQFRNRHAHQKGAGGSGLGLSITRRIVELHQGSIRVESIFGEGATFIVELPKLPAPVSHP